MSVGDWAWVDTSRNQAGNVRHVDKQVGVDAIGDATKPFPIANLRVCRKTSDYDARFMFGRQCFDLVIVNFTCFRIETVLNGIVNLA